MTVGGGTVALLFLVLLALCCVTVDGAIFVRKNRRDTPQETTLNEAKQLLHLEKRAASTSTPGHESQVLLNEFSLNGTEYHSRAFVHWSGNQSSDVVFILTVRSNSTGTADSQLWKSEDYGTTYKEFSFGPQVLISRFFVSPADPTKMVFIDSRHKMMYLSDDELVTHNSTSLPANSDRLRMHPDKPEWMLLYDLENSILYVTMNFGVSWKELHNEVYSYDWAVKGIEDEKIVHIEVHPFDSEDAFYKRCTIPNCQVKGDGIDTALGPFLTYSWAVVNEYILVQKVLMDGSSHLMVSYNRENFSSAYFPGSVKTQDFMLLDASEGQIFLAVNHGRRLGASVYLSDRTGHYYVLSLTSVHHHSFGNWFDVDMHRVKGLNGTYLANQQKNSSSQLTSLISFNKGGDWQKIPSPKDKNCQSVNCSLVLRLDMENFYRNWILSEERAPGFIIAHGHYGQMSEYQWNNLSVFTSSDGGWTWKESNLTGVYHFNILDQGSIVTAIKSGYQESSSQVFFSLDEGSTWHSEVYRNETLHVAGVLNEPDISTVVLTVYGHKGWYSSPWTMVKLNFTNVLSTKCGDKDYEPWRVSDHDPNITCLLGQEVSYTRKKAASVCFNGRDFVRKVDKTPCNCTEEDFECDFGYSLKNGICKKETWFYDDYFSRECTEHTNYLRSGGYRKVVSDKCVNGVASQSKYQQHNAVCPLVRPGLLKLQANMTLVATGQPVLFHLLQMRGSVHTTTYVWDFYGGYNVTVKGLQNAQHQVHTFSRRGWHEVQVTANNTKGTATSNMIRVRAEENIHSVAVFTPRVVRVGMPVMVAASPNTWNSPDSSLHFQYRFGDENRHEKDLLTYAANVSHTYNSTGNYTISVTAVNSISAVTQQVEIRVIDGGIVARLNFSDPHLWLGGGGYWYFETVFSLLEQFQHELELILAVTTDRLVLALKSLRPMCIDMLILPKTDSDPAYEMTAEQISQTLVDMVADNQTLTLSTRYRKVNITAVEIWDYTGGGSRGGNKSAHGNGTHHGTDPKDKDTDTGKGGGINYRAIYIAVPVVVVAGIVTIVVIVWYRKRSRANRYCHSLLNRGGDADPFFDEDDDLPLDMSDARDTGRDDPMLDLRSGN
ncbi:VPS10 domain-containing receptor SorCS3-like [Babylonia areolata]|uniref:VPS10 domain-containing receptor SorCS3-like n=1 Tax=Babylonia areolata TaxID=304850 RepID=UPI003FD4089A